MLFQTTHSTKKDWQKILISLFLALVFCVTTVLPVFAHSFEAQAATTTTPQELYVWGSNGSGRTGLGTATGNTLTPAQVGVDSSWVKVSTGYTHSLAINSKGELYSWGTNQGAGTGLGTGAGNTLVPTRVGTASNWKEVSAGVGCGLAINDLGELYGWGTNSLGRIGLGSNGGNFLVPTRVGTESDWVQVEIGVAHGLALNSKGELYSFGPSLSGSTGLGTASGNTLVPTQVGTASDWVQIAAGFHHSLAINDAGELYSWGSNANGSTGLGLSAGNTLVPTRVGAESDWVQIAAGQDFWYGSYNNVANQSLAINSKGELYSWGSNANGRTGLGTAAGDTLVPTRVGEESNWVQVAAGNKYSVAVNSEGELYSWGLNTNGRTGLGITAGDTLVPTRVGEGSDWVQVSAGDLSTTALTGDPVQPLPPIVLTPGTLNKTLQMPEGTPLDVDPTFAFRFMPVERPESRPVSEVPVISPDPTITLARNTARTEGGITTIIGSLNLRELLETLNFPRAGIYVYEISEVNGSSGLHNPPLNNMTYDSAKYLLTVLIDRDGNVDSGIIHEIDAQGSLGQKVEYINFVNVFTVITSEEGRLEVTKDVVGQFADTSQDFTFDLSLTSNPLFPLASTITAKVLDSSGQELREVTITDGSATFTLKHGERLVVEDLSVGTVFEVSERALEEFAPAVRVESGGNIIHTDSATPNSNLSSDRHILSAEGRNAADFTNTHFFSPIMGLLIADNTALLLAAGLALAALMFAAARRRRKIEEMPILV